MGRFSVYLQRQRGRNRPYSAQHLSPGLNTENLILSLRKVKSGRGRLHPALWNRIRMFLGLMNPDPSVILPSSSKNSKKNLDSYCFVTSF
jgi:hypothetical protein